MSPLSYRLRTELAIEAWHWNENGSWSDAQHQQGYWTSSDHSNAPILRSYGYRLPRRGNTLDQANNDGYSRVDDGDVNTYWKSNPYLDAYFTHEDNRLHPQWLVADLGVHRQIDAIRIFWGIPYATHYRIEYWEGRDLHAPHSDGLDPWLVEGGRWRLFPSGDFANQGGGDGVHHLCAKPIGTRYLRIELIESSGKPPAGSRDVRDGLGYAVREIGVGWLDGSGAFHDLIRHGPGRSEQSVIYVSSTDPWHRSTDRDPGVEQPGFDRVFRSGLTNRLPMLTPVAMLYDIPDNAAAEVRFLKGRRYPLDQIELGEEPDGQFATPEDYAALYIQFARALHQIDPDLQLGGPSLEAQNEGWTTMPDGDGNYSWINRFLKHLRDRHEAANLNFFSFEWYPVYDLCEVVESELVELPEVMTTLLSSITRDAVPHSIPWIISELGFSAFASQREVEIPAAILNDDSAALFLSLGGRAIYFYGYEPELPVLESTPCPTWGSLMMLLADKAGGIGAKLPTYYGAILLSQIWAQPSARRNEIYRAFSNIRNRRGQQLVTAYALHRPDHDWALLLINKDSRRVQSVGIRFHRTMQNDYIDFQGAVDVYQYSPKQYSWHAAERNGHPSRSRPPEHFATQVRASAGISLPPYSITVVRGAVPGLAQN